ncbi:MAG: hypothetical protein HRT58_22365 [Crocinitomicaceae bacterium]|nr:hypothetical protein [Flavobacteriales bacterium]NQZ38422.1 hypothetical protein [Crocinitomicaceae bacterium]
MKKIKSAIEKEVETILEDLVKVENRKEIKFDKLGSLLGDFDSVFSHVGIYAFIVSNDKLESMTYLGKAEGGERLRQHLTGRNKKNGELLKSTKQKNQNILEAIKHGYKVELAIYSHPDFEKLTLICIEAGCIISLKLESKNKKYEFFPKPGEWNIRVG